MAIRFSLCKVIRASADLVGTGEVKEFYLGISEHGERSNYRFIKESLKRSCCLVPRFLTLQ